MGKLQSALDWAARGFKVFPLVENGKEPAHESTWLEFASNDESAIRAMWTDPVIGTERDYNIGVECTDFVVVDIDIKEGKDGYNQYMQIGGSWDTLCVRTPSGGYHLYFEGPDSSNAPIARDVDIRSHNGYVVAPGSTIDGVAYEIVTDKAPEWVPFEVEKLLRAPYERRDLETQGASVDSEANVHAAIRFLESAPPAMEGQRGDETTFITAARLVREMSLSPQMAFDLMVQYWNPRCSPPWSLDELARKVENAAAYGTADVGRLDPSILFSAVDTDAPPSVFEQSSIGFGNALDVETIPARPWVLDRMLMLHELTLLLAPGSAGKSSVSLAIAAHLAMGRDFAGHKAHIQCKTIVYNGEDDKAEMSRRLYAVCQSYGLDYSTVKRNVLLMSSDDVDLKLVTAPGRQPVIQDQMVDQLISIASDTEVGLVVFDPLVDVHEVDETDNPQMNAVMKVMKRIARSANVCSLILHHTTKSGNTRQEDRVGNMDISRGASGIIYKSRIAFTLLNATQQDAEDYGMQDAERNIWVRLDDAKMNLALANSTPCWFRKEGVKIPNGDIVGVLKHQQLSKSTNQIRIRVAELLLTNMAANNTASMPMTQAAAILKAGEPLWANKTDTQIRQRLEGMFTTPVEIQGQTIKVLRETKSGKTTVLIVLT